MAQQTEPPYRFKLMGSFCVYPSKTWYVRACTAALFIWAVGFILCVGGSYGVGSLFLLAGGALGLYFAEIGYRRGKETD